MNKSTYLTVRSAGLLILLVCNLVTLATWGQNKPINQNSQPGSPLTYPDGPARQPEPFVLTGSTLGNGHQIYAPAGSIAVNENTTYNGFTAAQLVQNILVTGCLKASNVTFTGVFNNNDPTKRQLGYFNKA